MVFTETSSLAVTKEASRVGIIETYPASYLLEQVDDLDARAVKTRTQIEAFSKRPANEVIKYGGRNLSVAEVTQILREADTLLSAALSERSGKDPQDLLREKASDFQAAIDSLSQLGDKENVVYNGKKYTKNELNDYLQQQLNLIQGGLNTLDGRQGKQEVVKKKLVRPRFTQRPERVVRRSKGEYVTVAGAHIPICEPPKRTAKWEAVPGKLKFDPASRTKWAEVVFEKFELGRTTTLKPGDRVPFSKEQGRRLEVIDNILVSRDEVIAYNEATRLTGKLIDWYESLNPDDLSYEQTATHLATVLDEIRQGGLQEAVTWLLDSLRSISQAANRDRLTTDIAWLDSQTVQNEIEDLAAFQEMLVKLDEAQDFAERYGQLLSQVELLDQLDEAGLNGVPKLDPRYKMPPYFEKQLGEFATLVNRQLGLGNNKLLEEMMANKQAPEWEKLQAKGMTVVVGPRGTGKNKMVEHYAAITNRPLFRYPCSPDKEERDFMHDIMLQDGDIIKVPSRILIAVTTPNAIIELDEVNLLEPAVAKFFNSLLDGDRAIFGNNEVIKAAPGVVNVGLMNDADYAGVEDLAETIDDRSNAMRMDYPPAKETIASGSERFTHDEALIMKDHISILSHLDDMNFVKAWDLVVNAKSSGISLDTDQIKAISDLSNIIKIADVTRQTVRAFKTRTNDSRMEREISLRGVEDAVKFYSENHLWELTQQAIAALPRSKPHYGAAQYAVARTYMPHTETYANGNSDRNAIDLILLSGITP
ncbi:AAA family ATPase [Candidatus Woesebacteria bacterium]|nr:AAA family ATPase [Candidatus Woesebacteria bacterium]